MSTPQPEVKAAAAKAAAPKAQADQSAQGEALVGRTVAFVIFPTEFVPALVTAYAVLPAAEDRPESRVIDYEYIEHSQRKVDAGANTAGMIEHTMVPVERRVVGSNARWQNPCQRTDGALLALPQSGHLVPGTWFDPSPYLITVDCVKDEIPEVRAVPRQPGVLGRVLQAAVPGRHEVLGPFTDIEAACGAFRAALKSFDHVQYLFSRRR